MSEKITIYSIRRELNRWAVRIHRPDDDFGLGGVSFGSWNSPDAQGLLVVTPESSLLRGLGDVLHEAADIIDEAES